MMKELYRQDLKSLDSARESFHDRLKQQNESPEMGQDYKSRENFTIQMN